MKRNAIISAIIALMLSLSLFGCSSNTDTTADTEQTVTYEEVTGDDFQNAYYLLATSDVVNDSTMQSLYIVGDDENKVVRGTFTSMTDGSDKNALTAETELLLKEYSTKVFEALRNRAEEAGEQEAVEKWQALIDEEAEAEDAGALYDNYKAIITIKNSDGTVTIEGEREAGTDTNFNWQ